MVSRFMFARPRSQVSAEEFSEIKIHQMIGEIRSNLTVELMVAYKKYRSSVFTGWYTLQSPH